MTTPNRETLRLPEPPHDQPVYRKPRNTRNTHAYRAGWCDGYMLRESDNPYRTWPAFFKAVQYADAYARGRELRLREAALANARRVTDYSSEDLSKQLEEIWA